MDDGSRVGREASPQGWAMSMQPNSQKMSGKEVWLPWGHHHAHRHAHPDVESKTHQTLSWSIPHRPFLILFQGLQSDTHPQGLDSPLTLPKADSSAVTLCEKEYSLEYLSLETKPPDRRD